MGRDLKDRINFYLGCLKPRYLTPDFEFENISKISPDFLESRGIKALAFDVDLTLAGYKRKKVDPLLFDSFSELTDRFKSCIVSNTNPERKRMLEDYFGLPAVQTNVRKPFPEPFIEALDYLGTHPSETAMVGDRPLMDVAGAKRAGMVAIKAGPFRPWSEPKHHTLVRVLETFLLRLYQEEGISEKTYLIGQD